MDPTRWDAPFPVILLALFVIVMLRANATYWLGRGATFGTEHTRLRRVLATPGYQRAAGWLNRYGAPAVTASFLTVGLQTLINLSAGVTRMPLRRYLPAVVLGSIVWALIYGTIGFVGFQAFAALYDRSPVVAIGLALLLAAGLMWWIVSQLRSPRSASTTTASEGGSPRAEPNRAQAVDPR